MNCFLVFISMSLYFIEISATIDCSAEEKSGALSLSNSCVVFMSKYKIPNPNKLLANLSNIYSTSFLTVYPCHENGLKKIVNHDIPVRYFDEKRRRLHWRSAREDDI